MLRCMRSCLFHPVLVARFPVLRELHHDEATMPWVKGPTLNPDSAAWVDEPLWSSVKRTFEHCWPESKHS